MGKIELLQAEEKAALLFQEIENLKIIQPGKTEYELNQEVFALAKKMFGIEKYWHKRIVRAGANTLHPYDENPPDLTVMENDILFFDFGPIFEQWEADYGRTYVIGDDPLKHKLKEDIESAWYDAKAWFDQQTTLISSDYFHYITQLAIRYGWEYGGHIAGHLIGQFPHERLEPGNYGLYVHPENHADMFLPDKDGKQRDWILEIHFVDREKQIGGFFEQLLTNQKMEKLFSYGTLQLESVQLSTFHRVLTGLPDFIIGYKLSQIEITDPEVLAKSGQRFHPIVIHTGNPTDMIMGTVFEITEAEILKTDEYEVDDYKRVQAPLKSGGSAWVYVGV